MTTKPTRHRITLTMEELATIERIVRDDIEVRLDGLANLTKPQLAKAASELGARRALATTFAAAMERAESATRGTASDGAGDE